MVDRRHIFDWDNYRAWRRVTLSTLSPWIGRDVFDWVNKNRPKHFVSDDLGWIDEGIEVVRGQTVSIKKTLSERLPQAFRFARAFHGTRGAAENSFREHGLLPCDPETMRRLAHEIFERNELIAERAEDCFSGSYAKHNEGKVFFCLTQMELLDYCGHYLIYGSEMLGNVGNALGEKHRLQQNNRAMMIECAVPMAAIPPEFLECLAGSILQKIFENFCTRRSTWGGDFGFWIKETLAPENIIKFHYPKYIKNPIDCGIWKEP